MCITSKFEPHHIQCMHFVVVQAIIKGPAINFTLTYPADCYCILLPIFVGTKCHSMTFFQYVMTLWKNVMTKIEQAHDHSCSYIVYCNNLRSIGISYYQF